MSQTELIAYIVIASLVIFPLLWWLVTQYLKKSAGMDQVIDTTLLGNKVASYGTGSARINGINHNHCVELIRYQHGYLFTVAGLFGGGQRVVLDQDIVSAESRRYFVLAKQMVLRLQDGSKISLYGRLAQSIQQSIGT